MDIWIVAAAAGAGYIAQNCKNLLRGWQDFPSSSTQDHTFATSETSPTKQQLLDKNCPFRRVVSGKKGKDAYLDRELSSQDAPAVEVASTSGYDGENLALSGTFISSLTSGNVDDNLQGCRERVTDEIYETNEDLFLQPFKGEIDLSFGPAKSRSALRTRRIKGQFIKPLSSLESCLIAQLYKENAEMEDYVFSSVQSPRTPTTRPFLVTDGSRIVSRANGDSFNLPLKAVENQLQKNSYSQEEKIYGVPQLPKIGYMNFQREARHKSGQDQLERSSNSSRMANGRHQNVQESSHGAFLFCLGISMGVMSSFLANKREVDKLNELLKQSENLVQDLQEEIEMKDSLTVKELAVQGYESQEDTHNNSFYDGHAFSPEHKLDESTEHHHSICHDQEAEENSLFKIEAELEAELERLELRMNASSLEGKLNDLSELDPDFVPGVAVKELRADFFGCQAGAQPYADQDGSGSSTPHPANYAVSPRELSLRLHEVIQSRLEERVKELETALQNSQRKVKYMEYEHINSWTNLSSSEAGSFSTQGSPVNKDVQPGADQPVVINLSGEALDAYNEAYDLFTKINNSEEDQPSAVNNSSNGKCWQPCDPSPCRVQNGWLNSCTQSHTSIIHGQPSPAANYREGEAHNILPNDIATGRDESDDSHDEMEKMEKLLIKHIVEKARKGSSVVLNAQRALFSKDEN